MQGTGCAFVKNTRGIKSIDIQGVCVRSAKTFGGIRLRALTTKTNFLMIKCFIGFSGQISTAGSPKDSFGVPLTHTILQICFVIFLLDKILTI